MPQRGLSQPDPSTAYHPDMGSISKPELAWIDIDKVVDLAEKRFGASARKVNESLSSSRVEPTLAIVRSGLTGEPLADGETLDIAVSLTKTIQNAVGLFHQDVLGAVPGWQSTGASGGSIDLKGTSPVTKKPIVAEVKMRFNTIKASDEKKLWDDLDKAAAVSGNGTLSYIFQIVPRTNEPYDRPWAVSGRTPKPRVRCADGVTAYHLVTGHPNALLDLLNAMPFVTAQVAARSFGDSTNAELAFENSQGALNAIVLNSLPTSSKHR